MPPNLSLTRSDAVYLLHCVEKLPLSFTSNLLSASKHPKHKSLYFKISFANTHLTHICNFVALNFVCWLAEYAYTMTVTMAGNVYSFGVILLELLTGKPAVTEGTELVKWVLRNSTNQDYILDFNVSRTSQAVRNQMLAILEIARVCVSTSPESRPKMKSVLRMLLNAR